MVPRTPFHLDTTRFFPRVAIHPTDVVKLANLIRDNVKIALEASCEISWPHPRARPLGSVIMQATHSVLQEREVKIGEEERTRTRLRRESWCSRKMDKVRMRSRARRGPCDVLSRRRALVDPFGVCFAQSTLK